MIPWGPVSRLQRRLAVSVSRLRSGLTRDAAEVADWIPGLTIT